MQGYVSMCMCKARVFVMMCLQGVEHFNVCVSPCVK